MDLTATLALLNNPLVLGAILVGLYLWKKKNPPADGSAVPATPVTPANNPLMAALLAKIGPVGAAAVGLLLAGANGERIRAVINDLIHGTLDRFLPSSTSVSLSLADTSKTSP